MVVYTLYYYYYYYHYGGVYIIPWGDGATQRSIGGALAVLMVPS